MQKIVVSLYKCNENNMELSIMVSTQMSIPINYKCDKLLFVFRKRIYEEIPILKRNVSVEHCYGEVQIENERYSPNDFSDSEIVRNINKYLVEIFETGDFYREFFSKRGRKYEFLFLKRIIDLLENSKKLHLVKSYPIKGTDGARVIECRYD